jgi:hypothetical protein
MSLTLPGATVHRHPPEGDDIAELDAFVDARLPQRGRRTVVAIALLAHEPQRWARHWAEKAVADGVDLETGGLSTHLVEKAQRMVHAWTVPPRRRRTPADCYEAVAREFPALAASLPKPVLASVAG